MSSDWAFATTDESADVCGFIAGGGGSLGASAGCAAGGNWL
jgi:hypothetical protein